MRVLYKNRNLFKFVSHPLSTSVISMFYLDTHFTLASIFKTIHTEKIPSTLYMLYSTTNTKNYYKGLHHRPPFIHK
uniref:Uncharacterized protein n=1 Tax=Anguilla anguilla TaxID=7936 RepID=A0A0E9TE77_ANGAN